MSQRLTEAEKKSYLMREMIYQVVRDLISPGEATPEERDMARRYIFDTAHGVGSFLWACEIAGLDPDEVRAEVLKRNSRASTVEKIESDGGFDDAA